ncbi:MAG: crossover junction endodeoxyribonuclease RuvC [Candidatus Aureabacteria bacterium]|nr:crossover junction endodeoxyribonuclease RuvC [Candidatus Auribacterota bacterium]
MTTSRTSTPISTSPTISSKESNLKAERAAHSLAGGVSRILAIDPGTNATGYAILEERAGEILSLEQGVIKNPVRAQPACKLGRIQEAIEDLLVRHRPAAVVLEEIFYHRSVRAALRLGEVRGVCLAAAARSGVPVRSYAARRVKKAVVGSGSAGKIQVQKMVQARLKLPGPLPSSDAADALALGITYFQDRRWSEQKE